MNTYESKNSIKVVIILGMFLTAFMIASLIVNMEVGRKKSEYNTPINWDELKVEDSSVEEEITPIEGTISLNDYLSLRRQDSISGLAKIDGILPKSIVKNIRDGIDSQYYKDSVTADYYDLCKSIKELIKQCEYINKLYKAYQNDVGIEDINYCVEYGKGSKDRCELYDYFIMYSKGELKEYFLDTHNKWEALVNYIAQKQQLDEGYIDLYYQDEICTNLDYLDKVNVQVVVMNKDTYDLGLEEMQEAKDKGYLLVNNYGVEKRNYLSQLNLYRDINFYDGDMVKLADKTISSLFTTEAIDEGSLKSLGKDLTKEELEEQLSHIKSTPSESETSEDDEEYLELEDYQVLEYSLTGRDERDVYYVLYKVEETEHNMDLIPSKESMMDELTLKGKAMMAQQEVSQIVLAEVNDTDVSDTSEIESDEHSHTNGLENIISTDE